MQLIKFKVINIKLGNADPPAVALLTLLNFLENLDNFNRYNASCACVISSVLLKITYNNGAYFQNLSCVQKT